MRDKWHRLTLRERWLVGGGSALALALLLYALLWHPFYKRLNELRQTVVEQRAALHWMRQAAVEVKRLSALTDTASQAAQRGGQSLLTLVDQTARTAGLSSALTRVEPQGDAQLRISLEKANFDTLVRWLGALEQEYGVAIVNVVVERQGGSGQVDVRLILQSAPS